MLGLTEREVAARMQLLFTVQPILGFVFLEEPDRCTAGLMQGLTTLLASEITNM